MEDAPTTPPIPPDSAYIAHLWEYPELTIAIFGMQTLTPEANAIYEASGIPGQMQEALEQAEGFLLVRGFPEPYGGMQLQYWRSHEDLARFARQMPHMAWWKWLNNNLGKGYGFYHEIYQCKTAEAIYEAGTLPLGPAEFCETSPVASGEGRSQERQRRFEDARSENDRSSRT